METETLAHLGVRPPSVQINLEDAAPPGRLTEPPEAVTGLTDSSLPFWS